MDGVEPPVEAAIFTVGPPQPVTDSRSLPAVTAEDEAAFVHGADLGANHPDNTATDPDDADVDAVPDTENQEDDDLPSEDELYDLVAEVDADDVDAVGFDDADLAEPWEIHVVDGPEDRSEAGGA